MLDEYRGRRFTAGQAVVISGLSYRSIDRLAVSGKITGTSRIKGSNGCRAFSLEDVLAMKAVAWLKKLGVGGNYVTTAIKHFKRGSVGSQEFLLIGPHGSLECCRRDVPAKLRENPGPVVVIAMQEMLLEVKKSLADLKMPNRGKAKKVATERMCDGT